MYACMYVCMYTAMTPMTSAGTAAEDHMPAHSLRLSWLLFPQMLVFAQGCVACMHTWCVCISRACVQDFALALMMGTHPRLGADSAVLLLDAYVAASIADMLMADRW